MTNGGGIEYKVRRGKMANVHTMGPRPTWYGVWASVEGASGTLVWVLAGFVVIAEF